jgi:hypothetical protein
VEAFADGGEAVEEGDHGGGGSEQESVVRGWDVSCEL